MTLPRSKESNIVMGSYDHAKKYGPEELWYCREYWSGDSRDGQYTNGDGYHYFEMKGEGVIQKALEYYETDDGDERACEVPELLGSNWFSLNGFDEELELLEIVPAHEFHYIEGLLNTKK